MATGGPRLQLLTDAAMDAHALPGHPERPDRRLAAAAGVEDAAQELGIDLERPAVVEATRADLERVHARAYLDELEAWEAGGGGMLDPDTYLVRGSGRAARLAAGAALAAAEAVTRDGVAVSVAAVRPPGHHAMTDRGKGFCLLNNVAIAAARLRELEEIERLAIVDWDVHHGDGTAAIFATDPTVGYASSHEAGAYPGTGHADERGVGTTWNRPLPAGAGDTEFVGAWLTGLLPALLDFAPNALVVSAGFDAAAADPLADLEVTTDGFRMVAEAVGQLARASGITGVTVVLEGGYDLVAVRDGVAATVGGILAGLAGPR
jgi:acetoin utilization deacetylase AcuC-like enzyme